MVSYKIQPTHAQTSPSRALNFVYQNKTGNPIIVYGDVFSEGNTQSDNFVVLKTDGSNPPTTVVQKVGSVRSGSLSGVGKKTNHGFYIIVADDDYYLLTSTGSDISLGHWNEVDF